jgi:hypothetical protein
VFGWQRKEEEVRRPEKKMCKMLVLFIPLMRK